MTTTPPSSPPMGPPTPPVAVVPPPPMVVAPSSKPAKPMMGNISAMTTREWSTWTGGKPKYDWSGLDASAPSDYATPNQLRPIHVSSAQKGYNHRRKGIDDKFAKGSDHFNFARLVWKHLVDTSMDTIAYLPSTRDPQEMVSIVQYYSQYSLKTTRELSQPMKTPNHWAKRCSSPSEKILCPFVTSTLYLDYTPFQADPLIQLGIVFNTIESRTYPLMLLMNSTNH